MWTIRLKGTPITPKKFERASGTCSKISNRQSSCSSIRLKDYLRVTQYTRPSPGKSVAYVSYFILCPAREGSILSSASHDGFESLAQKLAKRQLRTTLQRYPGGTFIIARISRGLTAALLILFFYFVDGG